MKKKTEDNRNTMEEMEGEEGEEIEEEQTETKELSTLTFDCLETIVSLLDTRSALSLLCTSKHFYNTLTDCSAFWKNLVHNEGFQNYPTLKNEVEERLNWRGGLLHKVNIPEEATVWQKIFLKGVRMRKNLHRDDCEIWRMYMTGADHLPVVDMTCNTLNVEITSAHDESPFPCNETGMRLLRYWNEQYLVVLQFNEEFSNIFVWSWLKCSRPKFLYSKNWKNIYPTGLFHTAFFLHKQYLILLPDVAGISTATNLTSLIRVHDLTQDLTLVGNSNIPDEANYRRVKEFGGHLEAAHLHPVGDNAVLLCRVPQLILYVFTLPQCECKVSITLTDEPGLISLDEDFLDQRFLAVDNKLLFFFHDKQFYNYLNGLNVQEPEIKYGSLLEVKLDKFLENDADVEFRLDREFDRNDVYMEQVKVLSSGKLVCGLVSGQIVVKEEVFGPLLPGQLSYRIVLTINPPENETLLDETDEMGDDVETDGPQFCFSPKGDLFVVMRHFVSGRKVHAYNGIGEMLYCINLDSQEFQLISRCGYISLDMDGVFLVAVDHNRVVVWESWTGNYVRTILIPLHYYERDLDEESNGDIHSWKGHAGFAFTEESMIIIHNPLNAPVAADVFLFW